MHLCFMNFKNVEENVTELKYQREVRPMSLLRDPRDRIIAHLARPANSYHLCSREGGKSECPQVRNSCEPSSLVVGQGWPG